MILLKQSLFYGSAECSTRYISYFRTELHPRLTRFARTKINTPYGTTKYLIDKKFRINIIFLHIPATFFPFFVYLCTPFPMQKGRKFFGKSQNDKKKKRYLLIENTN